MKTGKDAEARGLELHGTIHSMKRRALWHDYGAKAIYMITLVVAGRKPLLGTLLGSPSAHVQLTPLGKRILTSEIPKINKYYPNVEMWKAMIMPDHIHFILYVAQAFPVGKGLGNVIGGFKSGCSKAYCELANASFEPLFEKGYNDKILLNPELLDRWVAYLDDNPRRLWIKRNNPQFFTILQNREIAQQPCAMVGNPFLLDIPCKEAVIYHRGYSDEDLSRLRRKFMLCADGGGVLVSAAIAPWEKLIMREAMSKGCRIILLRSNGFPPLYKPAGEAFDACAAGNLLQISPWEYKMQKSAITRDNCLFLNQMAQAIVMA